MPEFVEKHEAHSLFEVLVNNKGFEGESDPVSNGHKLGPIEHSLFLARWKGLGGHNFPGSSAIATSGFLTGRAPFTFPVPSHLEHVCTGVMLLILFSA